MEIHYRIFENCGFSLRAQKQIITGDKRFKKYKHYLAR